MDTTANANNPRGSVGRQIAEIHAHLEENLLPDPYAIHTATGGDGLTVFVNTGEDRDAWLNSVGGAPVTTVFETESGRIRKTLASLGAPLGSPGWAGLNTIHITIVDALASEHADA